LKTLGASRGAFAEYMMKRCETVAGVVECERNSPAQLNATTASKNDNDPREIKRIALGVRDYSGTRFAIRT
jgi:hypothetical protein